MVKSQRIAQNNRLLYLDICIWNIHKSKATQTIRSIGSMPETMPNNIIPHTVDMGLYCLLQITYFYTSELQLNTISFSPRLFNLWPLIFLGVDAKQMLLKFQHKLQNVTQFKAIKHFNKIHQLSCFEVKGMLLCSLKQTK